VAQSESLDKVSIAEQAGRLNEPFTMIDLAQIDDLVLSIYLCQGTMPNHRHLDQDELFLVHSGTVSLDSGWGTAILRPGDLAVAPKGVSHRSSSLLKSRVLLLQPRLMINRRNGNRRLYALKDEGRLEKVSVPAVGRQIVTPYSSVVLTHFDTFALTLTLCEGLGPWWQAERQTSLVFCYQGSLAVDTELGPLSLEAGELTIVPPGLPYRLDSRRRALALGVSRHKQPGLPLPE